MLLSPDRTWATLLSIGALFSTFTGVASKPTRASAARSLGALEPVGHLWAREEPVLASRAESSSHPVQTGYFDQLLDHFNPSLGTFKQRYFFSDKYYEGPGSPIIFTTPGEQSATGFNNSLTGGKLIYALMVEMGGAGVVLEHRYWGESSPYSVLTTENLTYLTLDQSMLDIPYFVENVKLPWSDSSVEVNTPPVTTPWVQVGCSYPGLLAAYVQQRYPTVFAASWASSAPVQADTDFWEYFAPVEQGMPKNCSTDLGLAIDYIDGVLGSGTDAEKLELKASFGAEALADDDFARMIEGPLFWWQSMSPWSYESNSDSMIFYRYCDAIETNADGTQNYSPDGVGQEQAVKNLAAYFHSRNGSSCPKGSCRSSYNYDSGKYTYTGVEDGSRQWDWMVCSEFGWFQTGDPGNGSRIVSKFVTEASNERQCNHQFPHADGTLGSYDPNADTINFGHGGWDIQANHLFVVNGQYDPWRSASVSSDYDPTKNYNTTGQHIYVIPGGHHCWDFSLAGADYNSDVAQIMSLGISQVKTWVQEWYTLHPSVQSHTFAYKTLGALPASNNPATPGTSLNENPNVIGASIEGQDSASNSTATAGATTSNSKGSDKTLLYVSIALNGVLLICIIIVAVFVYAGKKKLKSLPAGRGDLGPYYGSAGVEGGDYGATKLGSGKGPEGRGVYQTVSNADS